MPSSSTHTPAPNPCALAIETSTRDGSITFGSCHRDPERIIATAPLPQLRRHNVDLMPTIARLCHEHHITRHDIAEIYVSVGPGSFTGLRIAIATAKMLALTRHAKLFPVPTIDVIAHQITRDAINTDHLAVCMALKRDTLYSNIYHWPNNPEQSNQPGQTGWQISAPPQLRSISQLLDSPHPLTIASSMPLDDLIPAHLAQNNITLLDPAQAQPTSPPVYAIGRLIAQRDQPIDPHQLSPHYVRPPEAVELWEARQQAQQNQQ